MVVVDCDARQANPPIYSHLHKMRAAGANVLLPRVGSHGYMLTTDLICYLHSIDLSKSFDVVANNTLSHANSCY